MYRTIRWSLALVLSVGVAACGETGPDNGNGNGNGNGTGPVASVVVAPAGLTLTSIGMTAQLTASALDASGNTISGKTFTWVSVPTTIVTVNASGVVTAEANGSAAVTATTDGIDGTASITVDDSPITSVNVGDNFYDPSSLTVASGVMVTWNWSGGNPHTVTFDDGIGNSSTQTSGTHTRSFASTGSFGYFCTVHGAEVMSGVVIVQ
jgi:plastocyanin